MTTMLSLRVLWSAQVTVISNRPAGIASLLYHPYARLAIAEQLSFQIARLRRHFAMDFGTNLGQTQANSIEMTPGNLAHAMTRWMIRCSVGDLIASVAVSGTLALG